jgi:hypothetical protein
MLTDSLASEIATPDREMGKIGRRLDTGFPEGWSNG